MGESPVPSGILIITHGLLGKALLECCQEIVGRQERAESIALLPDEGVEDLRRRIENAYPRLNAGGGVLILVDMLGGTPCNTGVLFAKEKPVEVLTGVNLYMLISAFTHRSMMTLQGLAMKAGEDGRRSIVSAKTLLLKKTA